MGVDLEPKLESLNIWMDNNWLVKRGVKISG